MALPLPAESPVLISSGGILWRHGADGIEVCLTRNGRGWSIPRGPVLEDERLEDAARRQVRGRLQRRFGRVTVEGEHTYFFLFRAEGDATHISAGCAWVPFSAALRMVGCDAERAVLIEALDAVAGKRGVFPRRLMGTA